MSKDFDLIEFITSHTTPEKFERGDEVINVLAELDMGSPVQGFAPGGVITDQTTNYDKPYNKDLADAAAKALAAYYAGMSNEGGFAADTPAWAMTPQLGSAGSAADMFFKNLLIEAGVAELDDLTKFLNSPQGKLR